MALIQKNIEEGVQEELESIANECRKGLPTFRSTLALARRQMRSFVLPMRRLWILLLWELTAGLGSDI